MLKKSVIGFLLLAGGLAAQPMAPRQVLADVHRLYPKMRYWSSGFSLFFGGLAVYRGSTIGLDRERPQNERILAATLFSLGAFRATQAVYRFTKPYRAENLADKNYHEVNDEFRSELGRSDQEAFRGRMYKGIVSSLLAANYLAFYSIDRKRYDGFVYSGGALVLVAAFNFFAASPEEKAWKRLSNGDTKLSYGITPGGGYASVTKVFGEG